MEFVYKIYLLIKFGFKVYMKSLGVCLEKGFLEERGVFITNIYLYENFMKREEGCGKPSKALP